MAAMMEGQKLKPTGRALSPTASGAEKTVRVLFLLRNLILHREGRLVLCSSRTTPAQKDSYAWFYRMRRAARVCEGEVLRLPADTVITPLVKGCRRYFRECVMAAR